MRTKLVLSSFLFTLITISLWNCSPSRGSQSQGGSPGLIHTYIKGQDSTLYFISSIKYKGENHSMMDIDFTYLATKAKNDSVICNYTIISKNNRFSPKTLQLPNSEKTYTVSLFEKFYAEAINDKKYKYRYSFTIHETTFNNWINSSETAIKLNEETFKPKSYSKKATTIKNIVLFDRFN